MRVGSSLFFKSSWIIIISILKSPIFCFFEGIVMDYHHRNMIWDSHIPVGGFNPCEKYECQL